MCCLPLSEPPEVTVRMNCVSACCASELDTQEEDVVCHDNNTLSKRSSKCCCGKKRKTFKSQAKEEVRSGEVKHERTIESHIL